MPTAEIKTAWKASDELVLFVLFTTGVSINAADAFEDGGGLPYAQGHAVATKIDGVKYIPTSFQCVNPEATIWRMPLVEGDGPTADDDTLSYTQDYGVLFKALADDTDVPEVTNLEMLVETDEGPDVTDAIFNRSGLTLSLVFDQEIIVNNLPPGAATIKTSDGLSYTSGDVLAVTPSGILLDLLPGPPTQIEPGFLQARDLGSYITNFPFGQAAQGQEQIPLTE